MNILKVSQEYHVKYPLIHKLEIYILMHPILLFRLLNKFNSQFCFKILLIPATFRQNFLVSSTLICKIVQKWLLEQPSPSSGGRALARWARKLAFCFFIVWKCSNERCIIIETNCRREILLKHLIFNNLRDVFFSIFHSSFR